MNGRKTLQGAIIAVMITTLGLLSGCGATTKAKSEDKSMMMNQQMEKSIQRAEQAAVRAEAAAAKAEQAADRSEQAADRATKIAEKAEKIFLKKMKK